ncbi:MAG: Nif3-like dinuclear metal center hexameric protein [Bacteroidetes bacterium]|nr:Nif3-like dinuclear metal center hexameric protein [Bacteroidota bacterium]
MLIKEITDYLESVAPIAYQESYDNSGLIIGNPNARLKNALITLDVTEEVMQEAIREKCNLIIAHHPIVFSGLKKITGKNYVERVVISAIKNDIAIYAIHTNLDNIHTGVNKKLSDKLGVIAPRILSPKNQLLKKLHTFIPSDFFETVTEAIFNAGGGNIGNYSEAGFSTQGEGTFKGNEHSNPRIGKKGKREKVNERRFETIFPAFLENKIVQALKKSHPYEEVAYDIVALDNDHMQVGSGLVGQLAKPMRELDFLKLVKKRLNAKGIRYTKLSGEMVTKVAVCGGAGRFLLKDAIAAGAQVFVTSDFKYHDFFDAEGKIVVVDAGHFETEQFTVELLKDFILEKFPIIAPRLSKTITNPINYL